MMIFPKELVDDPGHLDELEDASDDHDDLQAHRQDHHRTVNGLLKKTECRLVLRQSSKLRKCKSRQSPSFSPSFPPLANAIASFCATNFVCFFLKSRLTSSSSAR